MNICFRCREELGARSKKKHSSPNTKYEKSAPASKAVDGNTDGIFDHHSCSKTINDRHVGITWWRVINQRNARS